jgi:hypothetical protein
MIDEYSPDPLNSVKGNFATVEVLTFGEICFRPEKAAFSRAVLPVRPVFSSFRQRSPSSTPSDSRAGFSVVLWTRMTTKCFFCGVASRSVSADVVSF